ncbi:MAG: hypothetical protein NTY38_02310 [Acidobacteria bacterium]|nr:hypothetical protein [Acidobacteriota bacterium]
MGPLVGSYYVALRSVLREKPWVRKCLVRCRHCGIYFLTDRRNAGRQDLGCPFGCRREHRRLESTRRSMAYYREPEGKLKKQALNARRHSRSRGKKTSSTPVAPGLPCPGAMLAYLCVVVGLIEGRRVQRWEVIAMLERTRRQHGMVRTRRLDQGVAWFNERPP